MSNLILWMFHIVIIFVICTLGQNVDPKCPGPLAYYKALGCKPVYKAAKDKCPYKFNCDFLKSRSRDKCYVNGKAYSVGEKLREADANPCDFGCECRMGDRGIATFACAMVDCITPPPPPGCYQKYSLFECCSVATVCPKRPEDIPTCVVNGQFYKDGQYFPTSDREKTCICARGYKGVNVEPFCAYPKHPYCDPYFRDAISVLENCAPVYYGNQSPQTDCTSSTRCQSKDDKIIRHGGSGKDKCLFGSLVLSVGDELNRGTNDSSDCVRCVCEVPPTVTCKRLPYDEC